MMRKHIIESIKYESYVCLKPSFVCDGVGVFALRPVKKGVTLFAEVTPDKDFTTWDSLQGVDFAVLLYLKKLCNTTESGLYLSQTVNNINLSYYVNHSDFPNVHHNRENDRYVTIKDIPQGEEILCKYEPDEIDW